MSGRLKVNIYMTLAWRLRAQAPIVTFRKRSDKTKSDNSSHSAVMVAIALARASATRGIIVGWCLRARKRLISLEGTFSH